MKVGVWSTLEKLGMHVYDSTKIRDSQTIPKWKCSVQLIISARHLQAVIRVLQ